MNKFFNKVINITAEITAYALVIGVTLGSVGFAIVVIKWILNLLGVL